ncbi:efflux RND transporter periplasmic adaptor subunit [Alteromonas sp. ASW11-130]|uniref:efflux RND transporter periplasmic adaptor subunit n=1 Tax=Alteromonas sp. ASW11-130 TaxID=3015775 RepID=UPI0022427F98|nr:efflux RND transporter periplasmic adaptor subunit [Alteromonas sp. ASW11-130]
MSDHPSVVHSTSESGKLQLWLTVALSTAILITLLFSAGTTRADKHKTENERAQAHVSIVQMQTSYQREQRIFGLIESARASRLGFERAGRIATINVEEGDSIKQGQVLAVLDTARLVSQQSELKARLHRAQADVTLANATLQRMKSVLGQGGASRQQVDEARARFEVATAQVTEVEAALDSLAVEIDKSRLSAPFDGMVGTKLVDEGTVVQAASPILTLGATHELQARLALPQALAGTLENGQTIIVDVGGGNVEGQLLSIQPSRNRQTRTIDALVAVPNTSNALLIGDMVSVTINTSVEEPGAWVPLAALTQGVRGLWTLLVVTGNGNPQLQSRLVEIIYATTKEAYVRGAIKNGDKFVAQGGQRLVPGQLVKTALLDAPGQGASL